ncbi:MAG: acyl-CoA dehydrogenase family protein [Chloroflexota bacterium]
MYFKLSEEQEALRSMARDFAEGEIAPHAAEWEEMATFPRSVFAKMGDLGLAGMSCPEEYSGSPLSRLSTALVLEEIARADAALATTLAVHVMVAGLIVRYGDEAQHRKWLPDLATGRHLGAFALTEPNAGSDATAIRTRAVRQGDVYVLDGTKTFVTSGGQAEVYAVMAKTDPTKRAEGMSCFIIGPDAPGFKIGKIEKKMGFNCSPTAEVILDNCQVPVESRLGPEGIGFKVAMTALDGGRVNIGATSVGVAQAAFEVAAGYAKERLAFGQPIGQFQAIQFMLADMATHIDAARLLVYRAADAFDRGLPATVQAAMAKVFATDMAMRVTTDAVQVLGGYGYVKEYNVERYMRNAKVMQIFEGTNQIQRIVIGRSIVGR